MPIPNPFHRPECYPFEFEGATLRIVRDDGDGIVWFRAADIARAMGTSIPRIQAAVIEAAEDISDETTESPDGELLITEIGLNFVIGIQAEAANPKAERFQEEWRTRHPQSTESVCDQWVNGFEMIVAELVRRESSA